MHIHTQSCSVLSVLKIDIDVTFEQKRLSNYQLSYFHSCHINILCFCPMGAYLFFLYTYIYVQKHFIGVYIAIYPVLCKTTCILSVT